MPQIELKASITKLPFKKFKDMLVLTARYDNQTWGAAAFLVDGFSHRGFGELIMMLGKTIMENNKNA